MKDQNENKFGELEGEKCNRSGCGGIIVLDPIENCSCHVSAPCSACIGQSCSCPKCGWSTIEEDL
jgi:hypothetical protein